MVRGGSVRCTSLWNSPSMQENTLRHSHTTYEKGKMLRHHPQHHDLED